MISSQDKALLQETYKKSKRAVDSINALLSKVYDDDLSYDLNNQLQKYKKINDQAADRLIEAGVMLENKPMDRAKMWSAVQFNTLFNTSTEHIADMMIEGNTKSMVDMMSLLKDNKNARPEAFELANELANFEEKNIQVLKSYL